MLAYKLLTPKSIETRDIYNYLKKMDKEYIPSITSLVSDLYDYSQKLAENAYIITAVENEKIIGILAIYINEKFSFISSVSVMKEYQGNGIFNELLLRSISLSKEKMVSYIELEAYKENEKAIEIYLKKGFIAKKKIENQISFRLCLDEK